MTATYSLPAMSMANEFADLKFLAGYVDRLVASTGDRDYAVVYEWDEDGSESGRPPVAVLLRSGKQWHRRRVLATSVRRRHSQHGYVWEVEQVNGH